MSTPTVSIKEAKKKPLNKNARAETQKIWRVLNQQSVELKELREALDALTIQRDNKLRELVKEPSRFERAVSPAELQQSLRRIEFKSPIDEAWAAIHFEWQEWGSLYDLTTIQAMGLREAMFKIYENSDGSLEAHWREKKPHHMWFSCGGRGADIAWCYSTKPKARDPVKADWKRLVPLAQEPTIHSFEGWDITVETVIRESLQDFITHPIITKSVPEDMLNSNELQEKLFLLAEHVRHYVSFQNDVDMVQEVLNTHATVSRDVLEAKELIAELDE